MGFYGSCTFSSPEPESLKKLRKESVKAKKIHDIKEIERLRKEINDYFQDDYYVYMPPRALGKYGE